MTRMARSIYVDRKRSALRTSARWIAVVATAALVGLGGGVTASAGPSALGGATEWTQLLNNAELGAIVSLESQSLNTEVRALAAQIEQLLTQVQSYEIMLRNIQKLPDHMLADVLDPVLQLRQIAREAGSIAESGAAIDEFLRSDLITDSEFERRGLDRVDVAGSYTEWNNRWHAAQETNLRQSGLTLDDVASEAALIDAIQSRFGSEVGQMQVLQGANQIAASLARQINDLRTITATQAQETSIAWGRVLDEMNRGEAAQRRHERQIHEDLEFLENDTTTRSLNDIFQIGE